MRIAGWTACAGEEQLSMGAAELNEFLTAMEIVRRVNAALLDAASAGVDDDRDLDDSHRLAALCISATIH
jgi:hypothetical protein